MKFENLSFDLDGKSWFQFFIFFSYIVVPLSLPGGWVTEAIVVTSLIMLVHYFVPKELLLFRLDHEFIKTLLLSCAFIVITQNSLLTQSLVEDELHHANFSLLPLLMYAEILFKTYGLSDMSTYTGNLAQLYDLRHYPAYLSWRVLGPMTLLVFWLCYRVFKYNSKKSSLLEVTIATLLLCFVGAFLTSGMDHMLDFHPPLRVLPWMTASAFLGLESWAFRIVSVIVIALGLTILTQFMKGNFPESPGYKTFLSVHVCTLIPLFYLNISSVEASIYAFTVWLSTLILVIRYINTREIQNVFILSCVVTIGTLLRFPTAMLFVLLLLPIFVRPKQGLRDKFVLLSFLIPTVVLPYFIQLRLFKHPAAGKPSFETLSKILFDKDFYYLLINNLTPAILLLLVFGFFLTFKTLKNTRVLTALSLFPLFCILYYIALTEDLWGSGRYYIEFVAPFAFLILSIFFIQVRSIAFVVITLFLLSMSVEVRSKLGKDNWASTHHKSRYQASIKYPWQEFYEYLYNKRTLETTLVIGPMPFNHVLLPWMAGAGPQEGFLHFRRNFMLADTIRNKKEIDMAALSQHPSLQGLQYVVLQEGLYSKELESVPIINNFVSEIVNLETFIGRKLKKEYVFSKESHQQLIVYRVIEPSP